MVVKREISPSKVKAHSAFGVAGLDQVSVWPSQLPGKKITAQEVSVDATDPSEGAQGARRVQLCIHDPDQALEAAFGVR